MKLYQLVWVAFLTTTVMCGSVAAEYQDNKMFGNGRFLRRLQNYTGKKPQPQSKDEKQSSEKSKAKKGAKTPTPAGKRPTANVPTPAVRTGYTPRPTLSAPKASLKVKSTSRSIANPKSKERPVSTRNSKPSRTADQEPVGFGMELEMNSDKVIVTKLDSKGNARKAGLKKGDVIHKAGGVQLGSLEEFEEITKILGQGDELEFGIESRGKKSDISIQFGKLTEKPTDASTIQPKKDNDYSFVPGGADKTPTRLHSVLGQLKENVSQLKPTGKQTNSRPSNEQQTIEQQRRQIEQMQLQIQQLKRQSKINGSLDLWGPEK